MSFRLDHDDRIVIIGPNGQGKTTLVKSIGARLELLSGRRTSSKQVKIGYFSQDQLDELRQGETVLEHVRDLAPTLGQGQHRAIAARMGFGREKIETAVEKLSGGEKVRLLLGLMAFTKPHVLILDEPTSHLDIDSREALIHALNEYSGAVLLITHDIYLAEAVADRLWLVHASRARPYEGDLEDYRALVLAADRPGAELTVSAPEPAPAKPAVKAPSAFTLKQRLSEAEESARRRAKGARRDRCGASRSHLVCARRRQGRAVEQAAHGKRPRRCRRPKMRGLPRAKHER
ncbi:MAG: ATP-binding cassette domain-containing protein [Terricaulis sp.]